MRKEIGVDKDAKLYIPFLNGVEVKNCFLADEEEGYLECYKTDESGKYFFTDETKQKLAKERIYGKVELILAGSV
jgi:hypothetical protein